MKAIEKLFIRVVGDNIIDSVDLHIRELEFLGGLKMPQVQALKRRLIKAGYVADKAGFLSLTPSGKELYEGEKTEVSSQCKTETKKKCSVPSNPKSATDKSEKTKSLFG